MGGFGSRQGWAERASPGWGAAEVDTPRPQPRNEDSSREEGKFKGEKKREKRENKQKYSVAGNVSLTAGLAARSAGRSGRRRGAGPREREGDGAAPAAPSPVTPGAGDCFLLRFRSGHAVHTWAGK